MFPFDDAPTTGNRLLDGLHAALAWGVYVIGAAAFAVCGLLGHPVDSATFSITIIAGVLVYPLLASVIYAAVEAVINARRAARRDDRRHP